MGGYTMIRGDPTVGTTIRQNPSFPGEESHRVLAILPYTGPYEFISCILKLSSVKSGKGYIEMSWERGDHPFWEVIP
jgi:hypothetical protein